MLKALRNPFGIMLLLASLVLAGLVVSVLDRWSGQAPWIILLGILAYAASVAVLHQTRLSSEQGSNSEVTGPDPTEDEDVEPDSLVLRRMVQDALQHLNNLAALSQCELVFLLPRTLGEITPLEKAQALREVLIAAMERLKPPGEATRAGAPEALQYHILYEAYVQGKPVAYILTRHNIADSTYHRNRRDAIDLVGGHVLSQEELIWQSRVES